MTYEIETMTNKIKRKSSTFAFNIDKIEEREDLNFCYEKSAIVSKPHSHYYYLKQRAIIYIAVPETFPIPTIKQKGKNIILIESKGANFNGTVTIYEIEIFNSNFNNKESELKIELILDFTDNSCDKKLAKHKESDVPGTP